MALSGSLTFQSASLVGTYIDSGQSNIRVFGGDVITQGDSALPGWLPNDFVGLNYNYVDPVSASANFLGHVIIATGNAEHTGISPPKNPYRPASYENWFPEEPKNSVDQPLPRKHYLPSGSTNLAGQQGGPNPGDRVPRNYTNTIILNAILHKRNGPYHHPSWKQIRGGNHPVARALRLNNTMSVDARYPSPQIKSNWLKYVDQYLDAQIPNASLFHGNHTHDSSGNPIIESAEFEGQANALHSAIHHKAMTSSHAIPNLKHTYEPSVVSKHKPFIFKTTFDTPIGPQTAIARMSLMNQMTYFADEKMNALLKIAGPNPTTGSKEKEVFFKGGQEMYEIFHAARAEGSNTHIFSETIFPRVLNTYRTHILSKPNYDEVPGLGDNGYDRIENRTFWRRSQSDSAPAQFVTQSTSVHGPPPSRPKSLTVYVRGALTASSDGSTRTRTDGVARNSQGFVQHTQLPITLRSDLDNPVPTDWTYRPVFVTGSEAGTYGPGWRVNGFTGIQGESPDWSDSIGYVGTGIVILPISTVSGAIQGGQDGSGNPNPVGDSTNNLHSSSYHYTNLEAYQPYKISLLSSWPLDVREDIFLDGKSNQGNLTGEPVNWLTSSLGGKGRQIGLTPHFVNVEAVDRTNPAASSDFNILNTDGMVHWISASHPLSSAANPMIEDGAIAGGAAVRWHKYFHDAFCTGTAGELAYSTKPTIFYYNGPDSGPGVSSSQVYSGGEEFVTASRRDPASGYRSATASLQYMRHTYPYNLPFYATNKIAGRDPFYNSYADFIGDTIKYLARDYSILPEFTISDNYDYYSQYFVDYEVKSLENDGLVYEFFTAEPGIMKAIDPDISKKKLGLRRAIKHLPPNDEFLNFHKLNFLHLHGAGTITASAGTSSLNSSGVSSLSNIVYEYDEIHGTQKKIKNKEDRRFDRDPSAVSFYKKYSHTDDLQNYHHLTNQANKGFDNDLQTIPASIKVVCRALKKLLPYDGFYPVTRTVQIGSYLSGAYGDELRINHRPNSQVALGGLAIPKPWSKPASDVALAVDSDRRTRGLSSAGLPLGQNTASWEAAVLQTFLEPLMAPGLLYNSIKSGVAVDHPIYTSNPTYFAPSVLTGAFASQSFGYGGFYMMGESRCTPSILTSKPDSRLPFEALYDLSKLIYTNPNTNKPVSSKLVSDFVDIMRIGTSSLGHYATMSYQPKANLPNPIFTTLTKDRQKYRASINNYLAETMRFFLDDQTATGVKFPIFLSDKRSIVNVFTDSTYFMDVSMEMGDHQVMSEGPRDGGFVTIPEHTASGNPRPFQASSSLRGYIYGPAIEIHPFSGSTTIFTTPAEGSAVIGDRKYDHYYGANLQDPAYQAYTPPYFYGKSHMYISYKAFGEDSGLDSPNLAKQQIEYPTLFDRTVQDSFYFEEYSTTGTIDGTALTPYCLPSTGAASNGANIRMKIDASVGIFDKFFEIDDEGKIEHVWAIAPKWVCPVLDFSSSITGIQETEKYFGNFKIKKYNFVTNSFHSYKTGRGMWGGYGTDPYDSEAMAQMYANENPNFNYSTIGDKKGIYFTIGEAFATKAEKNVPNQVGFLQDREENSDGFFSNISGYESGGTKETGSLGQLLGFLKPGQRQKKYEVGRFAKGKNITEAIAVIPYFDNPLKIKFSVADEEGVTSGFSQEEIPSLKEVSKKWMDSVTVPGDEIYQTREIIPGKHFLPIHKKVFENLLSTHLIHRFYNEQDQIWNNLHGTSKQTLQTAKACDAGKMIDILLGDEAEQMPGYQLPPEFDFINNAAVDPFQIMIIPFNHQLDKQDLVNIYQGIMPDISMRAEKSESSFTSHPNIFIHNKDLIPDVTYTPTDQIISSDSENPDDNTLQVSTQISMSPLGLANFLNPFPTVAQQAIKTLFPVGAPGGLQSFSGFLDHSEFYKNLKFMVFKIKQKAQSDYDTFRTRQILKAIKKKFDGEKPQNIKIKGEEVIRNVRATEVYGPNWPYDYFSLIEAAKIDIEIEVDS